MKTIIFSCRGFFGARDKLALQQGLLCGSLAVALAIFSGCRDSDSSATGLPDTKPLVDGNNAFAVNLYQQFKEKPGNLVFSPYSISKSLAVIYAGAHGQTEIEIAKTLHFNAPPQALSQAYAAFISQIDRSAKQTAITLVGANSLWHQKDYSLTNGFLDLIRTHFQAESHPVDFRNPAETAKQINSWFELKTNKRIPGAISSSRFTPDTRLLLCDSVYFKGTWETQFNPKNTRSASFSVSRDETVSVPMMYEAADFKSTYVDDHNLLLLELPYAGNNFSMVVLLPDAVDGVAELEQQLTAENLQNWLSKLRQTQPRKIDVQFPKFRMSRDFEMPNVLTILGVPSLFSEKDADLSGMTGTPGLFVSDAIHQSLIEVNESGTEAAAATWFQAKAKAKAYAFLANHPFIFLIQENRSGCILFLGRLADPSKE